MFFLGRFVKGICFFMENEYVFLEMTFRKLKKICLMFLPLLLNCKKGCPDTWGFCFVKAPRKPKCPCWKTILSFRNGPFLGNVLVFRGVNTCYMLVKTTDIRWFAQYNDSFYPIIMVQWNVCTSESMWCFLSKHQSLSTHHSPWW